MKRIWIGLIIAVTVLGVIWCLVDSGYLFSLNAAEQLTLAGIVVQAFVGIGAILTAFAWRSTYIARRKAEVMVEVIVCSLAYLDALRMEITLDVDLERSSEALTPFLAAWTRAKIDFEPEELRLLDAVFWAGTKWFGFRGIKNDPNYDDPDKYEEETLKLLGEVNRLKEAVSEELNSLARGEQRTRRPPTLA